MFYMKELCFRGNKNRSNYGRGKESVFFVCLFFSGRESEDRRPWLYFNLCPMWTQNMAHTLHKICKKPKHLIPSGILAIASLAMSVALLWPWPVSINDDFLNFIILFSALGLCRHSLWRSCEWIHPGQLIESWIMRSQWNKDTFSQIQVRGPRENESWSLPLSQELIMKIIKTYFIPEITKWGEQIPVKGTILSPLEEATLEKSH